MPLSGCCNFKLKTQIWRFEMSPLRFREPCEQKIEDICSCDSLRRSGRKFVKSPDLHIYRHFVLLKLMTLMLKLV